MEKIKLIAFDLDGVLVDGYGSWYEVHHALGTWETAETHAREYYAGEITFDEWAKKDAELWYGVDIERIREPLYAVNLMGGIEDTLPRLKERYKLAIISGGLQILADRIKERFDMDYAVANKLLTRDGKVCGIRQLVDFKGKGKILQGIAKRNNIKLEECAAIGDYSNDIPMFRVAGFRIAFNPKDDEIKRFADKVIYEKDLRKILPYFDSNGRK
jgi:phosphoserine phosphatase